MDKVLWRCNNVPRPPDRVVELGAELHVERPLTVAVAPLAPGGGEFHVALTNDHATLPLRLCTCDLGNPRFVHVKGRKMPADLAPGDRWDFDVEVVDTANFTDAYIELTFCWRCGDEAAGGPDVGRAPGTWAHFVAQEVIMWTSTKPKRPTPDDPPGRRAPGDSEAPAARRRRRRFRGGGRGRAPPPPFPEEDAPARSEEAAPDDAACAICDDAAGGARTPCCGTAICAACVARAAASANAAFKCAFCLDASPAFYAFARSVGARRPRGAAGLGRRRRRRPLPGAARVRRVLLRVPARPGLRRRRRAAVGSAAVWNLLACESCGVSYAHAGCLAKRRRGGFVGAARRSPRRDAPPAAGALALAAAEDARAPRRPPAEPAPPPRRAPRRAVPAPAPSGAPRAPPADVDALVARDPRIRVERENPKKAGSKSALRYDAYKSASTRATALPSFVKSCPAYLGRAAAAVALSAGAAPGIPNGDPAPGGRQFRSLASLRAVAPGDVDLDAFDFRHAAGRARCPPVPARSEINGALREIWGGLSKREQAAAPPAGATSRRTRPRRRDGRRPGRATTIPSHVSRQNAPHTMRNKTTTTADALRALSSLLCVGSFALSRRDRALAAACAGASLALAAVDLLLRLEGHDGDADDAPRRPPRRAQRSATTSPARFRRGGRDEAPASSPPKQHVTELLVHNVSHTDLVVSFGGPDDGFDDLGDDGALRAQVLPLRRRLRGAARRGAEVRRRRPVPVAAARRHLRQVPRRAVARRPGRGGEDRMPCGLALRGAAPWSAARVRNELKTRFFKTTTLRDHADANANPDPDPVAPRRVYFPLLAVLLRAWLASTDDGEASKDRVVLLVSGAGTPRDANRDARDNSTEHVAELMELFLARAPSSAPSRDDWADRFRVAISFADGAPARVSTIHKSLRLYRPTCMYVWQLKTFWEQRTV
ncbi:hypothetical protein JL720_492 [Aureococcus anophagefferens]|nr:hypothetical protein JL720_492 [Aureococcus anophagefferens]